MMIFLGVGRRRGLAKEKRGSSGIKTLHTLLYGTPKKSVAPFTGPFTKKPQAPAYLKPN